MLSSPAWAWYALAAVAGVPGLWLLYWSLLRDRSRGRRRCPRCWYDMSGTSALTCSECGRAVKHERRLFRTRRRWGWALVALLIVALGFVCGVAPTVQRTGIERWAPTTLLVLASRTLEHPKTAQMRALRLLGPAGPAPAAPPMPWKQRFGAELARRIDDDRLSAWQWRWLISRAGGALPPWSLVWDRRGDWPADLPLCIHVGASRRAFDWLESSDMRIIVRHAPSGAELTFSVPRSAVNYFGPLRAGGDAWREPSVVLGTIPIDEAQTPFDIVVQRRPRERDDAAWQTLRRETVSIALRQRPGAGPAMSADRRPELVERLRKYMQIGVTAEGIAIRSSRVGPEPYEPLPTLAVRLELLRDGQVVAETSAWWTTEHVGEESRVHRPLVPYFWFVRWERPLEGASLPPSSPGSAWLLRIASDPLLALRDVRSSTYWHGVTEIPLHWDAEESVWRAR